LARGISYRYSSGPPTSPGCFPNFSFRFDRLPSSVLRPPSSVLRLQSSVFRPPSSVFRFLLSIFCFACSVVISLWSVVSSQSSASPFVEVGTPVARRPPHRSRRAVFPHRALQPDTLCIAHRKVRQFGPVVLTELVAYVDFVRLSAPSAISGLAPCNDLLRVDPTPRTASAASPCR
jgi:hypothetical protein